MASVIMAYFLWIVGGPVGLHHFYLQRDKHCLLYALTFGGFFLGWLRDFIKLPDYVDAANKSNTYMKKLSLKMFRTSIPSIGTCRLLAEIVLPMCLQPLASNFIPIDEEAGKDQYHKWLCTLILPPIIAFGVWLPGCVGEERMNFKKVVKYSYACSLLLLPFANKNAGGFNILLTVFLANYWAKSWACTRLPLHPTSNQEEETPVSDEVMEQLDNRVHKNIFIRIFVVAVIPGLLFSISSYHMISVATVEVNGRPVPLTRVLYDFYKNIEWNDMWLYYERFEWDNFINTITEPTEVENAYLLLNLSESATLAEIRTRCRQLAKDHHPDRFKTDEEKSQHEERYKSIQSSCDALKARHKRRSTS